MGSRGGLSSEAGSFGKLQMLLASVREAGREGRASLCSLEQKMEMWVFLLPEPVFFGLSGFMD